MNQRILLIDDDPVILKSLALGLSLQGYTVTTCDNCADGLRHARADLCDLILLDVNLPDGDGYALCAEVRRSESQLPILMLTANVAEVAAVRGMESGADDYIRKPCGLLELGARIKRLLDKRRGRQHVFGSLRVDSVRHLAWAGQCELVLGKREFGIFALLVARAGEVLMRQEMLDAAGQDAQVYDRTVDSHLSHLRKKLKLAGAPEQIVPVYGVGYRLVRP